MSKAKSKKTSDGESSTHGAISDKTQLKEFLLNIRDKLTDGSAAPIYAMSALNYVMNLPQASDYLTKENKELARDIWLRLKQAGMQLHTPPMLFSSEDEVANL